MAVATSSEPKPDRIRVGRAYGDTPMGLAPGETSVKRTTVSPAPWFLARRAPEVYCRRDNRVYPFCPHAAEGAACPCLHALETADGLFEPQPKDEEEHP